MNLNVSAFFVMGPKRPDTFAGYALDAKVQVGADGSGHPANILRSTRTCSLGTDQADGLAGVNSIPDLHKPAVKMGIIGRYGAFAGGLSPRRAFVQDAN
jgi:hypothetical protein